MRIMKHALSNLQIDLDDLEGVEQFNFISELVGNFLGEVRILFYFV